jgi:hypothetical protein
MLPVALDSADRLSGRVAPPGPLAPPALAERYVPQQFFSNRLTCA